MSSNIDTQNPDFVVYVDLDETCFVGNVRLSSRYTPIEKKRFPRQVGYCGQAFTDVPMGRSASGKIFGKSFVQAVNTPGLNSLFNKAKEVNGKVGREAVKVIVITASNYGEAQVNALMKRFFPSFEMHEYVNNCQSGDGKGQHIQDQFEKEHQPAGVLKDRVFILDDNRRTINGLIRRGFYGARQMQFPELAGNAVILSDLTNKIDEEFCSVLESGSSEIDP